MQFIIKLTGGYYLIFFHALVISCWKQAFSYDKTRTDYPQKAREYKYKEAKILAYDFQ